MNEDLLEEKGIHERKLLIAYILIFAAVITGTLLCILPVLKEQGQNVASARTVIADVKDNPDEWTVIRNGEEINPEDLELEDHDITIDVENKRIRINE